MKNKKMRGFFDEQYRLEKLSGQNDPLKKLTDYIDFEFFRKPLEEFFTQDKDYSKGGRPAYDYVMMFKILILQRFYNLSDDDTEFAILDRLSFMRFLGLTLADGYRMPKRSGTLRINWLRQGWWRSSSVI